MHIIIINIQCILYEQKKIKIIIFTEAFHDMNFRLQKKKDLKQIAHWKSMGH